MTHLMFRLISLTLAATALLAPFALAAQPLPARQAPEAAARPGGAPVANGRYEVDPTHTFVVYEVGHYGTSTNRGRFSVRDGEVRLDTTGRDGRIDITVDIGSVSTGVDLLDRHLQSRDFFNVADFPTARFVAEHIAFEGDRIARVPGQLTLLGVTRPVTLVAQRFNCYRGPMVDRQVCGGDFEAVIKRSDWGMTWGLAFGFEDQVRLLVQVEAVAAGR